VAAQLATLKRQAGLTTADRLLRIADILAQTEDRLRFALSRRTQVETALIRCARTTAVSIDDLLRRIEALGVGGVELGSVTAERAPVAVPARRTVAAGESPSAYRVRANVPAASPVPAAAAAAPAPAQAKPASSNELEMLTSQWHEIIDRVGKVAPLAKGMMMDTRPLAVAVDRVMIGFDPEFSRSRDSMARNPAHLRAVQNVLLQVLKRTVNVELCLIQGDGHTDVPADHTAGVAGGAAAGKGKGAKSKQEWTKDPVVQKALEIFNGGIVDVRE